MSNQQVRETLAAGKKFIDGDWVEEWVDEHDWVEDLPFGYAADGVRVRTCRECKLTLVFNLDSQKDALIDGNIPKHMCGDDDAESFGAEEWDFGNDREALRNSDENSDFNNAWRMVFRTERRDWPSWGQKFYDKYKWTLEDSTWNPYAKGGIWEDEEDLMIDSFEAEKFPMPKLVGWEESKEVGGYYGALGRPIITVQHTFIGPRGGKKIEEVTYEANSKYTKTIKRAESFNADDDYTDEQLLKVARWDIENQIDNGTFYVLGEEPQAFDDGELDGENFYTIVSLYAQYQEDEERAEKILWNMFKKEYPQYLGDEMAAESETFKSSNNNTNIMAAESKFDKLSDKIAKQYRKKGMSAKKAKEIGNKTAYTIGRKKYGKAGMAKKARAGMKAESFGAEIGEILDEKCDCGSDLVYQAGYLCVDGCGEYYSDKHAESFQADIEDWSEYPSSEEGSFCNSCGRGPMGESTVNHWVARCPYNDPDCNTCENCSNHEMCDDPDDKDAESFEAQGNPDKRTTTQYAKFYVGFEDDEGELKGGGKFKKYNDAVSQAEIVSKREGNSRVVSTRGFALWTDDGKGMFQEGYDKTVAKEFYSAEGYSIGSGFRLGFGLGLGMLALSTVTTIVALAASTIDERQVEK